MMRLASLLLLALALAPRSAVAQTTVRLAAGGAMGSRLLGERVNPFDEIYGTNVTQRVAPTVQASIALPATPRYRVRLEAGLGMTTLDVRDEDTGDQREFGALKTLSLLALAEGRVVERLDWQIGVGQLVYLPAEKIGFFQDGGPSRWMIATGLTRTFPMRGGYAVGLTARYDYHQFTTPTLSDRGFSQYQAVHRAGLFLSLERAF